MGMCINPKSEAYWGINNIYSSTNAWPIMETTPFFCAKSPILTQNKPPLGVPSSGTWYSVLVTPSNGLTWFNLAHQYITAQLNLASKTYKVPDVLAVVAQAELVLANCGTFSTTYNDTVSSGGIVSELYAQKLAAYLEYYNNGLIGYGTNSTPFATFTYSSTNSNDSTGNTDQTFILMYFVLPVILVIMVVSFVYIGVRLKRVISRKAPDYIGKHNT